MTSFFSDPVHQPPPCTVYIYTVENIFSHLSICLAEGLKALGIPVYSNLNYWLNAPDSKNYLFTHDPHVNPQDCSIVVSDPYVLSSKTFLQELWNPPHSYITVHLDDIDGPNPSLKSEDIPKLDFIFRLHCHSRTEKPSNFIPWVFGLSNRILRETYRIPKFEERQSSILFNFRVEQSGLKVRNWIEKIDQGILVCEQGTLYAQYPLRPLTRDYFLPLLDPLFSIDQATDPDQIPSCDPYHQLQWHQTGHRHSPQYYQRLKQNLACAAFGGWLIPATDQKLPHIEWWDSWRLWESLATGCVTFHADFNRYGAEFPVMPENWHHYIGIDCARMSETVERIINEPERLKTISEAGRAWALQNYSPIPTALRFLEILGFCDREDFLPFEFRSCNFMAFPDWSRPDEHLYADLAQLLRRVFNDPSGDGLSLFIDTTNTTPEKADRVLSELTLHLLMAEHIHSSNGDREPAIIILDSLSHAQWQVLRYYIHGRVYLSYENQDAVIDRQFQDLPVCTLQP